MDAETGRFITADSYQGRLSDPVSLHKYLYANANPVMYADPSGYMAAEAISTSTAIAIIGSSVANAVALSIGLNLYEQLRLKDENGTTIDIGSLLADAFMSGCIAAGFAAAAILGASLGSVAVMVAIGGSSLIFAVLSFIAAYQAGECGYDDLALMYIILGCAGLYGADKCFDGAMSISTAQKNSDYNNTTVVNDSMIRTVNRSGSEFIPDPLENHSTLIGRNGSLKATGTSNSSVDLYSKDGRLLQRRFYGEDGRAILDVDFLHGNGDGTHTFPHMHIWDWTKTNPRQ